MVSGQAYERGDAVFQPTGSPVPLNQAERICADSIANIPVDEAAPGVVADEFSLGSHGRDTVVLLALHMRVSWAILHAVTGVI
ncbi:hypothetical protein [Burkholderia sp. SIMBA_062]|uniref:hypothetical protein n=1 Tax=Burkholderia sp. SIMBA_062 TaxID=3085803 RepID=UPI00397E4864